MLLILSNNEGLYWQPHNVEDWVTCIITSIYISLFKKSNCNDDNNA